MFLHACATTALSPLSLHDALPICPVPPRWFPDHTPRPVRITVGDPRWAAWPARVGIRTQSPLPWGPDGVWTPSGRIAKSEEHTSELQSRENLVCRLLLEKKKNLID